MTKNESSLDYDHVPYTWEKGIPMMDVWVSGNAQIKSMKEQRPDLLPIGRIWWQLGSNPKAKDMKTILASPQTEHLNDLDLQRSDEACLLQLAASERATSLRSLQIGGNVTDAGIQAIAASPHLKKLQWFMLSGYESTDMTDAKMEALMNSTFLPNMKDLIILSRGITPAAIGFVAKAVREGRLTIWPKFSDIEELDTKPIQKEFDVIRERKQVEKRRVADMQLDTSGKLEEVVAELKLSHIPKRLEQIISKSRLRLSQIRDMLNGFEGAYEALKPPMKVMPPNSGRADNYLDVVRAILLDAEASDVALPGTIKKKLDEMTVRVLPLEVTLSITRMQADVIRNREAIRNVNLSSLYSKKAYVEQKRAKRDTWWEEDVEDAKLGWPHINQEPGRLLAHIEKLCGRCEALGIDTADWRKEVDALRPEIESQGVRAKRLNAEIMAIYEDIFGPQRKKN